MNRLTPGIASMILAIMFCTGCPIEPIPPRYVVDDASPDVPVPPDQDIEQDASAPYDVTSRSRALESM